MNVAGPVLGLFLLLIAVAVALAGPRMVARYSQWCIRRDRLRWFADEFLPQLITAPAKESEAAAAAAHASPIASAAEPSNPTAPEQPAQPHFDSAEAREKLEDLFSRIPQSERERIRLLLRFPN